MILYSADILLTDSASGIVIGPYNAVALNPGGHFSRDVGLAKDSDGRVDVV